MYEEYMQNFLNYPINGYGNTYEQYGCENCGMNYEPRYEYDMVENYPYSYNSSNYNYIQGRIQNFQNRNMAQELEEYYPEIYKIVYPMVKKVCAKNNRVYGKEAIDRMVEEVYSNIEADDAVRLNITLNNEVRGETNTSSSDFEGEDDSNRSETRQIQSRRNNILNDLIRILILRELLRRPMCIGPNCRPGFGPGFPRPGRPNFPRYE